MNEDELTVLLDRAIGPGPTGPDLDVLLREGERSVRRRRAGVAGAVAAVAVIAGVAAVAMASTGSSSSAPPAVVQPTPPQPGPPLATETVSLDDFLGSGDLAELRAGGLLRLRPGVEVVRWVDNPLDRVPPDHSMGLVLRYDGAETWQLLDYHDLGGRWSGQGGSSSRPGEEAATFDEWLADAVELQKHPVPDVESALDGPEHRPLVDLRPDGTLGLLPGVTVISRVDDPVEQAAPNRSVGVAFSYRGRERWAVLQLDVSDSGRALGGATVAAFPDQVSQPSFEEFVAAHAPSLRR